MPLPPHVHWLLRGTSGLTVPSPISSSQQNCDRSLTHNKSLISSNTPIFAPTHGRCTQKTVATRGLARLWIVPSLAIVISSRSCTAYSWIECWHLFASVFMVVWVLRAWTPAQAHGPYEPWACCSVPYTGPGRLYQYTADLLALDLCRPPIVAPHSLLEWVCTLLKLPVWEQALSHHPDKAFIRYLLWWLRGGFRNGSHRSFSLRSATRNMPSTAHHPEVVTAYIGNECSLGRLPSPFIPEFLPYCHVSQMSQCGVIPKGHNMGRWRLIVNL